MQSTVKEAKFAYIRRINDNKQNSTPWKLFFKKSSMEQGIKDDGFKQVHKKTVVL